MLLAMAASALGRLPHKPAQMIPLAWRAHACRHKGQHRLFSLRLTERAPHLPVRCEHAKFHEVPTDVLHALKRRKPLLRAGIAVRGATLPFFFRAGTRAPTAAHF
jgi:hypothetical protein